jgi:adenosylcobinamide-GDP ribazoletransferase
VNRQLSALLVAVQFLTRVPVPRINGYSDEAQARSLCYYPLVGALLGLLLWLAPLPRDSVILSAALLLLLWVVITGGLHLDGLADSADAWAGGQGDAARTLAIMKDPASGPLGVAAICLLLLVKFAAIQELLRRDQAWLLMFPPILGRASILALLLTTPYVRVGGLASAMSAGLPRLALWMVLAAVVAGIWIGLGMPGGWLLAGAVLCGSALRWLMVVRIGGITGDTLGASVEIIEMVALVLLVWSVA